MLVGFFDGACEPINPGGTASFGAVLMDNGDEIWKDHGIIGTGPLMSNNVAEYRAVAVLLEYVKTFETIRGEIVTVCGDSQLVIKQLSGQWKAKCGLYLDEYKRACVAMQELVDAGVRVRLRWVPREENQRADDLSKLDRVM